LESAKDASSGGVAVALAKMSAVSGLGCDVTMKVDDERDIFSETFSRAILEVAPENQEAFEAFASEYLPFELIGVIGREKVKVNDVSLSLDQLNENYFKTFQKVIEKDL